VNFRKKARRIVFITMLVINYVYVFLFPVKADGELLGTLDMYLFGWYPSTFLTIYDLRSVNYQSSILPFSFAFNLLQLFLDIFVIWLVSYVLCKAVFWVVDRYNPKN